MTFRSKTPPPGLSPEATEQWFMAFGNMPKTKTKKSPANMLTEAIREMVELKYRAVTARVNTMGIYSEKLGKHIHSGATLGYEDIDCVIPVLIHGIKIGIKVAIEVKASSGDKLRNKQIKRMEKLESVGALYIEARSVEQVDEEIAEHLSQFQ